ncbi:hypothetical protein C8Q77DRAFT_1213044 [Trametes polyzona]|nr:hypothetical protein C8Q77DRAFT_1213044 [Trametes polyzona]
MHISLKTLPQEILLNIGNRFRPHDLASLLLVDTALNDTLTECLYISIRIGKNFEQIIGCLSTLSTDTTIGSGTRDLAGLVRSFHIVAPRHNYPYLHQEAYIVYLQGLLGNTLRRLRNLRNLYLGVPVIFTSHALAELLASENRTLLSMHVMMSSSENTPSRALLELLPSASAPATTIPSLVSIGVHCLAPEYAPFVGELLAYRKEFLIELCLLNSINYGVVRCALGEVSEPFSALQKLSLNPRYFFLSDFPHSAFPLLHTLVLDSDAPENRSTPSGYRDVPYDVYPKLEELSCDVLDLPSILREDTPAAKRRNVHTLQLNEATYDRYLERSKLPFVTPEWDKVVRTIVDVLGPLGGPLRHLSFHASEINFGELEHSIPRSLERLESLLIDVSESPELELDVNVESVCDLLSKLPHLHTLLFSDDALELVDSEHFAIAKDRDRQQEIVNIWGQRSPALRRVAFTTVVEWIQIGGGWVPVDD